MCTHFFSWNKVNLVLSTPTVFLLLWRCWSSLLSLFLRFISFSKAADEWTSCCWTAHNLSCLSGYQRNIPRQNVTHTHTHTHTHLFYFPTFFFYFFCLLSSSQQFCPTICSYIFLYFSGIYYFVYLIKLSLSLIWFLLLQESYVSSLFLP